LAAKEKNIALQMTIVTAAWVCFFMLPFIIFPYDHSKSPLQSRRFIYFFITSNVLLICFYYFNTMVLIPATLAKRKIFTYILIVLAFLFIHLAIFYFIDANSEETKIFIQTEFAKARNYTGPHFFAGAPMAQFFIGLTIGSGSKLIAQWFSAEERKDEITKQQLQTELSLLTSQVNPHFLFNTLNGIYTLAVTDNEKTADAVMKLSRIMRYTLEESKNDFVTLNQEIEFINSYIELQKIRLNDNVKICFKANGNMDSARIAPLLFIPFIENAFKYGISAHHDSKIEVTVSAEKNEIHFECANPIFPYIKNKTEKSTGIGISSAKRRLELLYENRHELLIENFEKQYKISLTINTSA
jgi:sensor histidine kinase YesM